ncbi:MAG: hypothetical protein M1816_006962 [Peltula sp. TS41687]|nr:MAG: hypothetical protein M1816_006962 [Peltula sp. TS41687]
MRTLNSVTPSATTASRRAQPVRQTRTNPLRSSARASGPLGSSRLAGEAADQARNAPSTHGFFPAITHFTDSINALPKEVVRHFSLLKEVDAKSYDPDNSLSHLADLALNTPVPNRRGSTVQTSVAVDEPFAPDQPMPSTSLSGDGVKDVNADAEQQTKSSQPTQPPDDSSDLARRRLFLNLRFVLTEMLMILDEKNHVISTASDELQKQLARAESSFPYIDNEISEEARYGSLSHWAFMEKGNGRSNAVTNERPRRDITASNALVAAAAALSEEGAAAASRSEIRREAMLARKSKTQVVETGTGNGQQSRKRDAASAQPTAAGVVANKGNGSVRSRKAADASSATFVAHNPSTLDHHPSKRRKTEKTAQSRSSAEGLTAGTPSVDVADAQITNIKGEAGSPSMTPAAEVGGRKRNRGGTTTGGNSKKRGNNNSTSALPSPALAASPINISSTSLRDVPAMSPVPVALPPAPRPTTGRGRRNSVQSLHQDPALNGRMRPSSSASNKVNNSNGTSGHPVDVENPIPPIKRTPSEPKSTTKASTSKSQNENPAEPKNGGRGGNGESKNGGNGSGTKQARDSSERPLRREVTTDGSTLIVTRGGSRSSKTSTPVSSTFPELQRSRSQRGGGGTVGLLGETTSTTKRSHKKGAGSVASAPPAPTNTSTPITVSAPGEDSHQPPSLLQATDKNNDKAPTNNKNNEDEEEEEENDTSTEPRYCYCNQVSYGSMVACDAKDCSREWFHLSCVGLTKPPGKNEVWYCDECKENLSKKGRDEDAAKAIAGGGGGGGGGIVARSAEMTR